MPVYYKFAKSNMKGKSEGRYYAKAVTMGEIHTPEIAKILCHSSTVTEGDVLAVLKDLTSLMKQEMGEGHTVVLDGLGRFKISIVSDTVADPSEFNASKHIRGLHCNFIAEGHHGKDTSKLTKPFTEGIKCKRAPINDVE